MHSIVQARSRVTFPAHTGERIYMLPFKQAEGLPFDLRCWQPTVDAMLDGIVTDLPIYLMVDQSRVRAGVTQRRPGVHIDGYWVPSSGDWKGDWNSTNRIGCHAVHITDGDLRPEALLLASNISACAGYAGEWQGYAGKGGDCSHIDISRLKAVRYDANRCYAGNVTALHESLPVAVECDRTVVRLSCPGVIV
jgi:hypothetical protein